MIRACAPTDAAAIAALYDHYVRETVVTFEETPVSTDEMARRIAEVSAGYPWLVWTSNEAVVAFAYATAWKSRSAYRFSVESTVYVAPAHQGRGIATALYSALLADLRTRGVHSVVGGIALPNPASVALHEKLRFEKIAHFVEVGRKLDRWIDVGYWQLLL